MATKILRLSEITSEYVGQMLLFAFMGGAFLFLAIEAIGTPHQLLLKLFFGIAAVCCGLSAVFIFCSPKKEKMTLSLITLIVLALFLAYSFLHLRYFPSIYR